MSVSAEVLRELHRIHRQRSDLTGRLEKGPRQIAAGKIGVKNLEAEYEAAREFAQKTHMAVDEKQLQLKQREDRIENLKAKLNTCGSNKEFQLLRDQIAADLQANSVLSDEILEMLEKLDEADAAVKKSKENIEIATLEFKRVESRILEEQAGLSAELERVNAQLEEAEAKLPVDFRADYKRMADAKGEDALAEVDGGCCGNCYQTLSTQTLDKLRLSHLTTCSGCGSVLYLPENRSVTS